MPDIRFLQVVPIPGREVVQRNFANLLKNGHQVGKEKYSFRRLSLNERFMLMYRGYVLREAQQAEAPEGAEGHRKEARRQEEQEGSGKTREEDRRRAAGRPAEPEDAECRKNGAL
ncbi:hypothetical protein QR680_012698 [Steinernema hermaphroditum]|uniref:Uncharacterized protein n=1 Tax=Steinernema hermaphroditum TaxID=289476 RepID=A0AA39I2V1_9BILA|nr:hypothetical protein QR680_012698 [Steinernema hermaphroditum]